MHNIGLNALDPSFNSMVEQMYDKLGIKYDPVIGFDGEADTVVVHFARTDRVPVKDTKETHYGLGVFDHEHVELAFWAVYNSVKAANYRTGAKTDPQTVFASMASSILLLFKYTKDVARWLAFTDALTVATVEYEAMHGTPPAARYREFVSDVLEHGRDQTITSGLYH